MRWRALFGDLRGKFLEIGTRWRRGGDSNPRDPFESTRVPGVRLKPGSATSPRDRDYASRKLAGPHPHALDRASPARLKKASGASGRDGSLWEKFSMLYTPICDYFGIKYPILLAGMGGVAMHKLVAAVSNAGGLGVLGAASLSPDDLRTEIRKTRELTDKPFAVDLLPPIPDMMRPHVPVMIEEKVKVFVAGLSVPQEFVKVMHDNGMKIVVMCGKVHHGVKSQDAGADVVVAQGTEAGGHTAQVRRRSLVPQMIESRT